MAHGNASLAGRVQFGASSTVGRPNGGISFLELTYQRCPSATHLARRPLVAGHKARERGPNLVLEVEDLFQVPDLWRGGGAGSVPLPDWRS